MNREPDDWITINGQHVPIFEGESKREAVSKFIKNKTSKVKKNKYDKIEEFKKRKATNKYNVSNDGNKYELNEDERKKVMHKLGLDRDNKLKKEFEVSEDGTRFVMKPELREKYEKKLGLNKYRDLTNKEEENVAEEFANQRRNALAKFTQNNREQIDKWTSQSDDKTYDRIYEKTKRGEGLTLKEYYQYLGRAPKEGDIIIAGGKNGEDVRVGKNGKLEIIKNFKKRKASNK